MSRLRAACAAVVVSLALPIAAAVPASAHATLISSSPADGAVLAAPPSELTLTFNEPVAPLVLKLVTPDGRTDVLQASRARDAALVIPVHARLPEGTHLLSWRVISLDGHPVGGTIVFSVGAPGAAPPSLADSSDTAVLFALWVCKLVLYAGLFAGAGGSFFVTWLDRGSVERSRSIMIALILGLGATPLAVGLQGADALGLPLRGLASAAVWRAGLETSFGLTAIAAALALFGGLFALEAPSRHVARTLSLAALLMVGGALALSGHASSASPQWLTRPSVFIHVLAVAFWLGSLIPLAASMRDRGGGNRALAIFSRAIPYVLAALLVSGLILAVIQVAQLPMLLATAYGRILCAKLAFVALLLIVAAWNRFRLTPAIAAGAERERRQLRLAICIELAIALIILGLVAAWRFTPPPRALLLAAAKPALLHIHTPRAMADVTFEPGHAGVVRMDIAILTGDFAALEAKEVQLTLEDAATGIEPISRPAAKGPDAVWRVEGFLIPHGGRWNVRVDILVNDFEKITLEDAIALRAR
ncbi:MAG: copper resistance protein CopC [Alphaproteobacteria bacterium]